MKLKHRRWIAGTTLIALLGIAPTAHANLIMSVQSVTAAPGDVNHLFDVTLTNTGPSGVDVGGFNFDIVATSTDITFQGATTGTTLASYIFAGNSLFGPTISTTPPGTTLQASDAAVTGFTVVSAGATFGLGAVAFNVASNAPNEIVGVDFSISSTSVIDENGNSLSLSSLANGDITITSPVSSVPEPSSAILFAAALAGLLAVRLARRKEQ